MNNGIRIGVLLTPRVERTPESDVIMIMTNLSEVFSSHFDPPGTEEEFLEQYYRNLLADESYSGDDLVKDYIELVNAEPEERDSFSIFTPSLASIAWWIPSLQRLPGWRRPVNGSTIITSPSFTT